MNINELYIKYAPQEGKAYTVARELLRATAHIYNRYYNDGDIPYKQKRNIVHF